MSPPAMLAVAHGTRCGTGQAQVRRLVSVLARRRPELEVHLGYLDLERPRLRTVASRMRRPAVAVPLLFAAGHHVRTDIPGALRGTAVAAAPPLGPDPALTEALASRLAEAGALDADAVVLAAAGSRDRRARADVRSVAADLAVATERPVTAGYAGAARPLVAEAVAALREAGAERVAVAAMLLADGRFHRSLGTAGADVVTRPLGGHPRIPDLIFSRYEQTAPTAR